MFPITILGSWRPWTQTPSSKPAAQDEPVNLGKDPELAPPGTGLPFRLQISAPAKGEYFLRIGVHDVQGDKVGVLEVPVAAVSKLPPMPTAAAK